ncbi:MAG: hypothetical protein C4521_06955 [Actinobacteria bacterium]|nr:MAG: hypothetical protein C4521_06955 [Actinomycetota bacterium]
MLVTMAKVEIVGPKPSFYDVVALLHSLGTLHIEDLGKKIMEEDLPVKQMEIDGSQLSQSDELRQLLTRVTAIIQAFHALGNEFSDKQRQKAYDDVWRDDAAGLRAEVEDLINQVEARSAELSARESELESELSLLTKYEPILHKIQPLAKQIVTTGGFESVALLIERRYKAALDELKAELNKITKKQCEIVSTDVDEKTTAAIVVFNKVYSEPVHRLLAMENVNQVRLPPGLADQPFDVAYQIVQERMKQVPEDLAAVREDIRNLSDEWLLKMTSMSDVLNDKIQELSTIPKFGQTEYAFVITGWLPKAKLPELEGSVKAAFGDDVIVTQVEMSEKEMHDTPVAYRNNPIVKPFELVYRFFGTPRYGSLDPVPLLALFYPLFFGLIVGDAGYGLVIVLTSLILRLKFKANEMIKVVTQIFGMAGTAAIVFGLVYGEFFGNLLGAHKLNLIIPIHIFGAELPLDREKNMITLLAIAVVVGASTIIIGLILGVVNSILSKSKKHAMEKGGLAITLVAVFVMLAATVEFLPGVMRTPGIVLLMIGIALLLYGGGPLGVFEVFGTLGNILSFARIMALGLAGAVLASVANSLTEGMGIAIGVFIAIILHALNILISAFSPTIHAFRLNFIEFFGKFVEDGGVEYEPFHRTSGAREVSGEE